MTRLEAINRCKDLIKFADSASELVRYVIKEEMKDLIIGHNITKQELLEDQE